MVKYKNPLSLAALSGDYLPFVLFTLYVSCCLYLYSHVIPPSQTAYQRVFSEDMELQVNRA